MQHVRHLSSPVCGYCRTPFAPWPPEGIIEPCQSCKRPSVFITIFWTRPSRILGTGLLSAGTSLYGIATLSLVLAFIVTPSSAREFVKAFTLLLFLIGSVLAVDGILALRTGVDLTWRRLRYGTAAKVMGAGKLAAAAFALMLVLTGVSI